MLLRQRRHEEQSQQQHENHEEAEGVDDKEDEDEKGVDADEGQLFMQCWTSEALEDASRKDCEKIKVALEEPAA
jgi:hypothetical protein